MQLKEGYKNTELGIIPEDWLDTIWGDVLKGFSSGMTPYRGNPEYYKGDIRWITSGELKYNVIDDTIEKITQQAVVKTNLKILKPGTFLMAITGLEAAGTRGSCGIVGKEATTNQSCMAIYGTEKALSEFLYHFYVKYGDELAFKYCQGTKQQSYTGRIAKVLPINLPPTLEEQQAIATALSEVDTLITNLEKLITKKKAIKQGAMQQLLKSPAQGGKRLPGFDGEWVDTCMKEICWVNQGLQIAIEHRLNTQVQNSKVYITIQYLNEGKEPEYILEYSDSVVCKNEDVLMTRTGNTGIIVTNVEGVFHNNFFKINYNTNKVDKDFLVYFLSFNTTQKEILERAGTSTIPDLNHDDFYSLPISLPKNVKEQEAISSILSDMDKDIESLEQKKSKYIRIKQGMMQELLTGKTRLI